MTNFRNCAMGLVLMVLSCGMWAQSKPADPAIPSFSDAQKLEMRDAQHNLDTVTGQIKDLTVQFQQIQQQVQSKFAELTERQKAAQTKLNQVQSQMIEVCGDKTKFTFNQESLACEPVAVAKTEPLKPSPPVPAKK